MTNVYNTGTVSVSSNSNIVTGIDTYFQSVGNISEGDLFTLDGKAFFEIYQIDTDNQLRIKGRLDGQPYAGDPVNDVEYSIIQNFAEAPIAQVAQNVVLLQQKWHQREDEMTGWFNSKNNYYQITNQHGEKVLVVTPTGLTKLVDGTIDIGDGSGLAELVWENLQNIPETATRWAKFSEITDKPEHVLGYPSFDKVTGVVSTEQLPDSVTKDKRTEALGLPVKTEASLTHKLIDYPKLKKTETVPTESPNNRREMLFDDVRNQVHIALTADWFTIPTAISHRKFMVKIANRYIQFNSAYTGNITMRVYPLGGGGNGLPNNPSLSNNQWHTITESVSGLSQLARDFEGIIDYVELNGRWQTFDSDQSHFPSIDAYYATGSGTAVSPFRDFYLRKEGENYYWYSDDITPETPRSMGGSWSQDATNKKLFTVNGAVGSSDALRFFSDNYDSYELELIIKSDVDNDYALTVSNSDPNIVYFPEIGRYITNERLYFKRKNQAITGTVEVESIKMRLSHYG